MRCEWWDRRSFSFGNQPVVAVERPDNARIDNARMKTALEVPANMQLDFRASRENIAKDVFLIIGDSSTYNS